MFSSSLIVAFLMVGVAYASLDLPSYMKPCGRSDPGFEACAVQSAQETIKHILNGDRKYKIPAIDPLEVTEITAENKGSQQVGIDLKIRNAKLHGFKDTVIKAVKINYDQKKLHLDIFFPKVDIEGDYEVKGRILLLPITGKGPLDIKLEETSAQFDTDWIVQKKDGVEYLKLVNSKLTKVEPKKASYKLENLFNGDKLLGPEMNTVMNENWKAAFQELSPPIVEGMSRVIATIVNNVAEVVEYDKIFPLKV